MVMTLFGLFKEPKNIIELFTFDLTTFFYEEDYEEISSKEEQGVLMIEYEKNLPWTEMDLFEKVIFRVFSDKTNLDGSNHINVRFPSEAEASNLKNTAKLINALYRIYGSDDENKGEWTSSDESIFKAPGLLRQWTLGEGKLIYTVKLDYTQNHQLILHILFFNHLTQLINN